MMETDAIIPKPKRTGRVPAITLPVVLRIAERFARGVPLKFACRLEGNSQINEVSLKKSCQRNPEFRDALEAAGATFIDDATRRLNGDSDLRSLRWLLERRWPEFFGGPAVKVENNLTIHGLEPDLVKRLRGGAMKAAKVIDVEPVKALTTGNNT